MAPPAPSTAPAPRPGPAGRRLVLGLTVLLAGGTMAACSGGTGGGSSNGGDGGGAPRFVDEAATAGLDHRYDGGFEFFVGGGVAVLDCDDDGRPELFLAGGAEPAALFHNDSPPGGALRFSPLPTPATDLTAVTGAYPLDLDSDGILDLVVLRNTRATTDSETAGGAGAEAADPGDRVVLRGQGGCRFAPFGPELGLPAGPGWATAFSATWEPGATLPTLAFGRYLAPGSTTCDTSELVRPTAAGTGGGYDRPVPLSPGWCPLSMLFSDWNRTGRRDLRVSNDRHYYLDGSEQLWRIDPGAPPAPYTEADGWRPLQLWGMGIASHDVTADGRPEVYLTSQGDNKLQTLADGPERPTYRDLALEAGVTAQRPFTGGDVLPSTAWHPQFADVNNDGWTDLLVTKGNVEAQLDYATKDPTDLLLGRPDGTFVEGAVEAGTVDFTPSRGAAVADLNLDGLLDLVVVHRRQNVGVWRNVGAGSEAEPRPASHWLQLRLRQLAPNVDAVGAWLEVETGPEGGGRTQSQEVTVGGGHLSGQATWLHTGLGDATTARVRVTWPDGEVSPWLGLDADQRAVITRGAAEPEIWTP